MVPNRKIMEGGLLPFAPLAREVIKNVHLQFAQSMFSPLTPGCWIVTPIFQQWFVYFPPYWRGNFLCSSSGSCLLPPCSIRGEGERELEGCSNTSGQNKSFLQRHHVIHLLVNDTSSSYSSLNDLVCVALLVVRGTGGGSLEMSLVIVWRCKKAERDSDRNRGTESLIFNLLHSSGRHFGTLHQISQTLIRTDLGSQHDKTALNLRGKTQ